MAKIINSARNIALAENYVLCETVFSKFMGLMLSTNRKKSLVFVFKKERLISLHMFFVFYPIDVLFIDKRKIIVEIKENFMPFTFYTSKKQAMYVMELPDKIIKKTRTGIGDKIEF